MIKSVYAYFDEYVSDVQPGKSWTWCWVELDDGGVVFRASGFARPIPGVDPRRNLHGISFAVANMTGFLARAMSLMPDEASEDAVSRLVRFAELKEKLAAEASALRWVQTLAAGPDGVLGAGFAPDVIITNGRGLHNGFKT